MGHDAVRMCARRPDATALDIDIDGPGAVDPAEHAVGETVARHLDAALSQGHGHGAGALGVAGDPPGPRRRGHDSGAVHGYRGIGCRRDRLLRGKRRFVAADLGLCIPDGKARGRPHDDEDAVAKRPADRLRRVRRVRDVRWHAGTEVVDRRDVERAGRVGDQAGAGIAHQLVAGADLHKKRLAYESGSSIIIESWSMPKKIVCVLFIHRP